MIQGFSGSDTDQASFINGVATMSGTATIDQYLKTVFDGTSTQVQVSVAGDGVNYSTFLTLNDVNVDLVTLLANHQFVLA